MTFSNERFLQNFLENEVQTKMLLIDGFAGSGQKTRFLASHVGNDGMVLSFHEDRQEANKTAASLFMAGIQDRVTVENGRFSEDGLKNELGRLTKADIILLDYRQTDKTDQHRINNDCEIAWQYLKEGGQLLVILSSEEAISSLKSAIEMDLSDFSTATFTASDGCTLLFEKKVSKE